MKYVSTIYFTKIVFVFYVVLYYKRILIEFIATNLKLNLKVLGISNSKKMLVSESEIDLDNWKDLLNNSIIL